MVLKVHINNNGQKCQKPFVKNIAIGNSLPITLLEDSTALYFKQSVNKREEIIPHPSLSHLPWPNKAFAVTLIIYILYLMLILIHCYTK